jgi:hypothetical protein
MRSISASVVAGAVSFAAIVTLAACGGESGPLDRAAYAKKADEVCEKYNVRREQARDDLGRDPTRQEVEQAVQDVVIPSYREQLDELRGIEPLETERLTVAKIWDDYDDGIDEFAAESRVDIEHALEEEPAGIAKARDAAADYGMTVCSSQ